MKTILKAAEQRIPLTSKAHTPKKYFTNREGLYVWSTFANTVLAEAKATKSGKKFELASFDLAKDAYDADIEPALPEGYMFSETDACAAIAALIEKQAKGENGPLLTNGYANLFYTPSRVVYVCWGDGEWSVDDWPRGGDWDAGYRVFSLATDSQSSDSESGNSELETLTARVEALEKIIKHHNLGV